ncbi:oxalate/formate antiporter [Syncephalis pseudoplumigaleata]|uniref:Oxalate/formate antiporter n=1 Tax=Syncephalis pseudoplumigaleata TaxID=1712513 RepID=A0A4P9Z4T2_9FUNG|nr:oxalate/formate antiporter [Syncephalis pseudoplumigaleata]|eukprot:RKP26861.1 oxalate/formate antiporter [Syncephalis pseudoplumigaleata]
METISLSDEAPSASKPTNPLARFVNWHYGNTKMVRTESEIENDRRILCFAFQRWMLLPAAFLVQFALGSIHAWSVFNQPIDKHIFNDPHRNRAPNAYLILIIFNGASACIMGPWLERHGPRSALAIGASLFAFGHLVTALAIHVRQISLVYIGYGVLTGSGLGLSYISPVSTLQKWFPDRRGFAAGFAVCGFGAGSMAFAKVPLPIMDAVGLPLTFVILGAVYFTIIISASRVLRVPPPDFSIRGIDADGVAVDKYGATIEMQQEGEKNGGSSNDTNEKTAAVAEPTRIHYTLIESLSSREYRLLYPAFLANCLLGLVAISRLSNMATDLFQVSREMGSNVVSGDGAFSILGRIMFAWLSDSFGRKRSMLLMMLTQIVCLVGMIFFAEYGHFWPFTIAIWVVTACFGGGFSVMPAMLTDLFGSKNVGGCHGVILTAWAIAGAAGGLIFTAIYDYLRTLGRSVSDPYIYNVNFYWVLAVCVTGLVIEFFLRISVRDRLFPPVPGQITQFRVGTRILRISTTRGIEWLSRAVEDDEWYAYWENRQPPLTSDTVPASMIREMAQQAKKTGQSPA